MNKLIDMRLDENVKLVSLDVKSLFTNVPINLAINNINNRWHMIEKNTKFSKEEFIAGIRFILLYTFFKFDRKIYKQTFGSPMGSPLSPVIADITMQDLEEECVNRLLFKS